MQSFLDCLLMISLAPSGLLHPRCFVRPWPLNTPDDAWVGGDPDMEWSDSLDVYVYLYVSPSFPKFNVHGLE